MRDKFWLIFCGVMIVLFILAIVDIFISDISFIHGNGFGLITCMIAIIGSLVNYFTN